MFKAIAIVCFVYIAIVQPYQTHALKYTVCEPDKLIGEFKDIKINECESDNDACPFVRGFNKSIEIDFVAKQKIEQVKVKVTGKINTLPMPFHVNPDNACGNYGFDCPLEAGKAYKFKLTMPILRTYPKLNVEVNVRLIDEKGDIITCLVIPARIQEPQKV